MNATREYVFLSGSLPDNDLDGRQKVRSQAMLDFRRRQRLARESHNKRTQAQHLSVSMLESSQLWSQNLTPFTGSDLESRGPESKTRLPVVSSRDACPPPGRAPENTPTTRIAVASSHQTSISTFDDMFTVTSSRLTSSNQEQAVSLPIVAYRNQRSQSRSLRYAASKSGPEPPLREFCNCPETAGTFEYRHCTHTRARDHNTTSMSLQIDAHPDSSASDRRALHHFLTFALEDMAGVVAIGGEFWYDLVPKLCQSEGVMRRAAIALSQAHVASHRLNPRQTRHEEGRLHLSTMSYLSATRALVRYIQSSASPSYQLVLTCCIMLHTVEGVQGHQVNANIHLQNGLAIFNTWRTKLMRDPSSSDAYYQDLSIIFASLDLSATILDEDRTPSFVYDNQHGLDSMLDTAATFSTRFTGLYEAHIDLMRIGTAGWSFIVRNRPWRDVILGNVPDRIVAEYNLLKRQYGAWGKAMHSLEKKRLPLHVDSAASPHQSASNLPAEHISSAVLWMLRWNGARVLEESLDHPNTVQCWNRDVNTVLMHAHIIVDYAEQKKAGTTPGGQIAGFSPIIGVSSVLLVLAHRTTLPEVRQKALELAARLNFTEGIVESSLETKEQEN